MSEQSMGAEAVSPRQQAVAYLEMMQHKRTSARGDERGVKARIVPEKVGKRDPLVESVAAYEQAIQTLKETGHTDLAMAKEQLRPEVYKKAQNLQMGAKAADFILFWSIPFWMPGILFKGAGMWATNRYRPIEWAVSKKFQADVSKDASQVVDNLLRGGQQVEPVQAKPMAFSGVKPQAV